MCVVADGKEDDVEGRQNGWNRGEKFGTPRLRGASGEAREGSPQTRFAPAPQLETLGWLVRTRRSEEQRPPGICRLRRETILRRASFPLGG